MFMRVKMFLVSPCGLHWGGGGVSGNFRKGHGRKVEKFAG